VKPPVLILGMHRSGTSLLSRLLSQAGYFAGADLQDDHESVFFIRTNNWILRQANATWDYPEPFPVVAQNPAFTERLAARVNTRLSRPGAGRYAGDADASGFYRHHALPGCWGWKDPRNCYTLPVWLRLYPEARVIHITRHGVDVAQSLVAREHTLWQRGKTLIKATTLCWPRDPQGHRTWPFRTAKLEGAFSLWEAYLIEARRQVANLKDQACEVSYESFLADPLPVLEKLCRFAGLPGSGPALRDAAGDIRPERAYAYRRSPELQAFAEQVGTRLVAHGFGD
jgi:hypothetical protein